MEKGKKIKIAAAGLAVVLAVAALNNRLVVRQYTLPVTEGSLRMLLLSDLHSFIHGNDQRDLISMVIGQKPDVILLAGDIADDHMPFKGTELLLKGIKGIPTFYVTGNHEYWSDDAEDVKAAMAALGVTVLEDEYVELEINGIPLLIAGIEDPMKRAVYLSYDQEKSMASAFSGISRDDGRYKILLAHRPEKIERYLVYPFDLVVSGHSHGGQVRIPFLLNGLYSPNQGFFPKYAGGVYKHGALTHIVSRGIGIDFSLWRVFNPPEIVVINLKSGA